MIPPLHRSLSKLINFLLQYFAVFSKPSEDIFVDKIFRNAPQESEVTSLAYNTDKTIFEELFSKML